MNQLLNRAAMIALVLFATGQAASAQGTFPTLVSPAAPAVAPTTIWNRLGIPYGFNRIRDARVNRRGNRPQLERKPPLKAIADPVNLLSDHPAIKTAAEVKQKEDAAPQKIKAIKYLAKIGCGCYDKNGDITAALVGSLDPVQECTPEVRMAVIEAVQEAMEDADSVCGSCGSTCCCNEELAMALSKTAYERDDEGCFLEPSEEIRQAAAELLRLCCPGRGPVLIIEGPVPEGGPGVPEVPEVPADPAPEIMTDASSRNQAIATLNTPAAELSGQLEAPARLMPVEGETLQIVEPTIDEAANQFVMPMEETAFEAAGDFGGEGVVELAAPPSLPVIEVAATRPAAAATATLGAPQPSGTDRSASLQQPRSIPAAPQAASGSVHGGSVAHVDAQNGVVHLQFAKKAVVPVGTKLTIYHQYITGKSELGQMEVVHSSEGAAMARPVGLAKVWKIARGDEAVIAR